MLAEDMAPAADVARAAAVAQPWQQPYVDNGRPDEGDDYGIWQMDAASYDVQEQLPVQLPEDIEWTVVADEAADVATVPPPPPPTSDVEPGAAGRVNDIVQKLGAVYFSERPSMGPDWTPVEVQLELTASVRRSLSCRGDTVFLVVCVHDHGVLVWDVCMCFRELHPRNMTGHRIKTKPKRMSLL